tara:strand:+ start:181 stop:714 length:534 start_codon:yes stop_codon:yes gene_type:complete
MNDDEFAKFKKRYQGLMYLIAHRIGGDRITNDFDDSIQDLSISGMDAVRAYKKKTGRTFEDFFGTVEFDKYAKTVLWNKKNNTGNKIVKKYKINNKVTIQEEMMEGKGEITSPIFFDAELNTPQRELASLVLGDYSLIKPNGKLNITRISAELSQSKKEVRKTIDELKYILGEFGNE